MKRLIFCLGKGEMRGEWIKRRNKELQILCFTSNIDKLKADNTSGRRGTRTRTENVHTEQLFREPFRKILGGEGVLFYTVLHPWDSRKKNKNVLTNWATLIKNSAP
jgi:hypothetical protein